MRESAWLLWFIDVTTGSKLSKQDGFLLAKFYCFFIIIVMHMMHNDDTTAMIFDITGVILAGGKSRRMGQDKACLSILGKTLFARNLELLQTTFSNVIIAGDRPDLATEDVPAIPDIFPGSALGGLYTGLASAKTDWIFVVPCDMPFPDSRLLAKLLDLREQADAVVPETPASYEPVFALYHKNCLPVFAGALQQGQRSIFKLFPRLNVRFLNWRRMPDGWEKALLNVNTPQDLADLKEITP